MAMLRVLSASEQVAEHLRAELENQTWTGMMPGGDKLARELGVGGNTIEAALKILENDGWLENRGRRRGRKIHPKSRSQQDRRLRVSLLLLEPSAQYSPPVLELARALEAAGHQVSYAGKSQKELGHNTLRIARHVKQTTADAWVVCAAPRETLKWFEQSGLPSFAYSGRANQVQIPSMSPDKAPAIRSAIQRLYELGHRRMVYLCRPERRIPEPGLLEREFIKELKNLGIVTGSYNLPDWDEDIEGFHRGLGSLFGLTAPTAVFVDDCLFVTATIQFCTRAGLRIPEDFSLISTDYDPSFAWCLPSIAHIRWESRSITRRIVQWADHIALGKQDINKGFSKARFVDGGTVGRAKG
ncbi:MAG: substrate-binding domain-containing protein [Verrucomicrobiae bacterium]|nr:substrate-binding domain-containing protein [Verrucomicrobiae bacterium]NNJ87461.1 substrate-binding domain-containing protein [Akkermansiaceae bacterium]